MTAQTFLDSLCSWKLVVGVPMAYRDRRWLVRRVSSAAIRLTWLRIRRARVVTSSRLPIGVATTNRVPGMWRRRGERLYCTIGGSDPRLKLILDSSLTHESLRTAPALRGRS